MSKSQIKVAELFAGVGGFRIGLEGWKGKSATSFYKKGLSSNYRTVWSNQWEPSTKRQDASQVYISRFGAEGHSNTDIAQVPTEKIPDHDLLVGGFPCQDYSVARTLNKAEGLRGKKGVLWWQIERIIREKGKNKPKYLFLENVDRLLKSPATQRGRDFAIMLASLADLGYAVEWRVINAAEYGFPQRRRRVFFIGYHKSTDIYKAIKKLKDPEEWITEKGVITDAFAVDKEDVNAAKSFELEGSLEEITDNFNTTAKLSPFENSGLMIDRKVTTCKTTPSYDGSSTILKDIILTNGAVGSEYYIDEASFEKWEYLKGSKKETRVNKSNGIAYNYAEGAMVFPDDIEKPSRTIITGEGGSSPSRFKHVIRTEEGKLRRLTPIELERLNMFPDDHTAGASDVKRAFFMGNALVVGIIEKIGVELAKRIAK